MRKFWITIGIILLLLIILNFALEPVALHYANKSLSQLEGYEGKIRDIDIALWRGAYKIDSLDIVMTEGDSTQPFFSVSTIDLSVEWRALFHGAIVGKIVMENPVLYFTMQPSGEVSDGGENDYLQIIDGLIPIKVNRFEVISGQIHYKDPTSSPPVDIGITDLNAVATNLNTVQKEGERLPSSIELNAHTSGNGSLNATMGMNVLKEIPDFDLALELDNMELTYLTDFTEAYAAFTFKDGNMYLSSEIAMEDGEYTGYVKPVLEEIDVIDLNNESTTFWRKAWEVVVGTVLEAFENQPKDQFATKVPFSGTTRDSEVGVIATIGNVLKNAFIDAFSKNIDQTVTLESIDEEKGEKKLFDFLKPDKKEE